MVADSTTLATLQSTIGAAARLALDLPEGDRLAFVGQYLLAIEEGNPVPRVTPPEHRPRGRKYTEQRRSELQGLAALLSVALNASKAGSGTMQRRLAERLLSHDVPTDSDGAERRMLGSSMPKTLRRRSVSGRSSDKLSSSLDAELSSKLPCPGSTPRDVTPNEASAKANTSPRSRARSPTGTPRTPRRRGSLNHLRKMSSARIPYSYLGSIDETAAPVTRAHQLGAPPSLDSLLEPQTASATASDPLANAKDLLQDNSSVLASARDLASARGTPRRNPLLRSRMSIRDVLINSDKKLFANAAGSRATIQDKLACTDEVARVAFETYDVDKSGFLSRDELFDVLLDLHHLPGGTKDDQAVFLEACWALADADGSGTCNVEEFTAFYRQTLNAIDDEARARKIFDKCAPSPRTRASRRHSCRHPSARLRCAPCL
jgi:hypothetical protein